MNIHEASTGSPKETHHFEEGIVITDEPGIYIAGSHGIRIEYVLKMNLLYAKVKIMVKRIY
ncbi:M24 family metallopeptidase [Clostridium botulinum]|uniref:M24 family metallopeptidase n=1 Tax=Clostridium botulinum TaxID=1491 RepID=UPI003DA63C69